jgi:phytoene dehydrogenase-like protein
MALTTNHYDLVVLGQDVAGLVAAALVARRNKRVLVMPHGSAEGSVRLGGLVLPLDTAPVVHMGTAPVQRVFQELGLWQQIRRDQGLVEGMVHWVLPRQRLDILPPDGRFGPETAREWPDDAVTDAWSLLRRWTDATDEMLDQLLTSDNALVADGFWSRRFLSRVASQLPGRDVDELAPLPVGHPLRAAARAVEPWLQHLSPVQLGKAASLRLWGLWARGPGDVPRGLPHIRKALLQRIELHSGEVKPDLRVAELQLRRGKVVGLSLLGKRDRYGCDHVIVAMDPRRLLAGMLTPEHVPKPLAASAQAIVPVAYRFVMHAEIDERGLSPGLAGTAVCLPTPEHPITPGDSQGETQSRATWAAHGVGHTYLRLGSGSREGVKRLSITRVIAPGEDVLTLRERILEELDLRGVLPFCHDHLSLLHSPHDGREATDGRGRARTDLGAGTAMQVPMDPLYAVDGEPSLGVGVLPHGSGIKNLSFASRLTLPGLGLEGEFAAGTMAAGLVAAPGKSPFSRSPLLSKA